MHPLNLSPLICQVTNNGVENLDKWDGYYGNSLFSKAAIIVLKQ